MRYHVVLVVLIVMASTCEAVTRKVRLPGIYKKQVGYKFLINETLRETYTLTAMPIINMFSMLLVVPYHTKTSLSGSLLNTKEKSPFRYTRVSDEFEDCNINEPSKYVPKDGEFIIVEVTPGHLINCPNRIDMVLEWDLQMSLSNYDPYFANVKGNVQVATVEKPLISIMQDLKTKRHLKFGYKMYKKVGAYIDMVDDVMPPVGEGENYSQYSFFLMRRMPNNSNEMCGLTFGASSYHPLTGDKIVIVIKKWKEFRYVKCNETRDQS